MSAVSVIIKDRPSISSKALWYRSTEVSPWWNISSSAAVCTCSFKSGVQFILLVLQIRYGDVSPHIVRNQTWVCSYHLNGVCVDESLSSNVVNAVHQSLLAAEEELEFLSERTAGVHTPLIHLIKLTYYCKSKTQTHIHNIPIRMNVLYSYSMYSFWFITNDIKVI